MAIVRVTRNESSAAGEVIAAQNAAHPPTADCHTMAANGSSTMTLNQIDAAPARAGVEPVAGGPATGATGLRPPSSGGFLVDGA